jgi:hypothetical protein
MLGAVEAALSADPGLFLPVDRREFARSLNAGGRALEPEAFNRLLDEGRRLTLGQAVALYPESDLAARLQLTDNREVR